MDPREYLWQMGDLADQTGQLPQPPMDYLRAGAQAVVGGLGTMGEYLGVPRGEQRNAAGEVVFPVNALERGLQGSSDAQTAIAAGVMGPGGKAPPPGAVLGLHPTTTPRAIRGATLGEGGGYSVNLPSGQIPTEGYMIGRYKNTDPRNTVVPQEMFKPAIIKSHVERNAAELAKPESHLGTWVGPDGNVYLDTSMRFPVDKIRAATKAGERAGQIAGWDISNKREIPIGNWREFVASPEQYQRWADMEKLGGEYLAGKPTREWWDMHGTPLERVYGEENLPQVAGFSASTAPNTNPTTNMSVMSEYMRRYLAGEPTIQPNWRNPETGIMLTEGKKMPMEQSRIANLEKSAAGNLAALSRAKVRSEGLAMAGEPDVAVIDRWHVRGTEAPERGIFANAQEGVINTATPKRGVGDYDYVQGHMRNAAQLRGRDLRDWSADVWTGLRETAKRTGQLFGTKFRSAAVAGESQSYADTFQDLIRKKANKLGISVDEMDHRLRTGNANLLSQLLASSPALWAAYQSWESGEAPGSLARQDQYQ